MKNRFLKKVGKNTIFGYNEILARRSDIIECDEKGNPVDGEKPKQPADEAQTPAAVRAAKAKREEVVKLADDETDTRTAEQKAADEEKKAELIKFAKDRFGVNLDPDDSLAVIEKRIAKLTSGKPKAKAESAPGE